ncbi:MAG: type II secretion system F family protein [Ignavibacteriae bacterium]|nr:type II secretion system F family protein [Ignavibacteriota bacterium]
MSLSVDIRRELHSSARSKRHREVSKNDNKDIFGDIFQRITDTQRARFCTQLAVLIQARVPLHRALNVLAEQEQNQKMKNCIESIAKEIQKGASLSKAFQEQHHIFESLFSITAEVGQESGRLGEVLSYLALYLEKVANLKRKFRQAMMYPSVVISVAVLAVIVLLVFIVPTFAEMYKSIQVELPATTQAVLWLSAIVTEHGMKVIGLFMVIVILSWGTLKSPRTYRIFERLLMRLPYIGEMFTNNHIARFCRTLGTLLHAQVSLIEALNVTRRILPHEEMQKEIELINKHVQQGNTVAGPLIKSKIFPPMVAQMIAVGEETSELDAMLLRVAEYYEKELDSKMETLSSIIEPVIILLLGIIVAVILVSMYLPMFDVVNMVGG